MGTTSIVKKACPCYFNVLEKTEVLEQPVKFLNEISFDEFKSKIPDKIYNQMLEDKFPNYIQTDDNSVKTVLEDNSNEQIQIYYHGEYNKSDKKNGKGQLVYIKDGQKIIYHGIWEEDDIKEGKIYYENDDIYEGEIKNYNRDGEGKFTSNLEIYEGHWKNDKKNGKGTLIFKNDGTKYEGEFKDNQFSGKGILVSDNGFSYEGDFLNNQMHGKGYLIGSNNHTYEGNFQNGFFHGKGKFKWNDKLNEQFYEGSYSFGKKDGNGSFHFKNGDIYTGEWKSGSPDGIGIYETQNRKYEGNWRGGMFMQLMDAANKSDDAKEENVNLNFMIPQEDIFINDHLSTSSNSNNSKSCLLSVSVEVIK
jgi:hypothetical protein